MSSSSFSEEEEDDVLYVNEHFPIEAFQVAEYEASDEDGNDDDEPCFQFVWSTNAKPLKCESVDFSHLGRNLDVIVKNNKEQIECCENLLNTELIASQHMKLLRQKPKNHWRNYLNQRKQMRIDAKKHVDQASICISPKKIEDVWNIFQKSDEAKQHLHKLKTFSKDEIDNQSKEEFAKYAATIEKIEKKIRTITDQFEPIYDFVKAADHGPSFDLDGMNEIGVIKKKQKLTNKAAMQLAKHMNDEINSRRKFMEKILNRVEALSRELRNKKEYLEESIIADAANLRFRMKLEQAKIDKAVIELQECLKECAVEAGLQRWLESMPITENIPYDKWKKIDNLLRDRIKNSLCDDAPEHSIFVSFVRTHLPTWLTASGYLTFSKFSYTILSDFGHCSNETHFAATKRGLRLISRMFCSHNQRLYDYIQLATRARNIDAAYGIPQLDCVGIEIDNEHKSFQYLVFWKLNGSIGSYFIPCREDLGFYYKILYSSLHLLKCLRKLANVGIFPCNGKLTQCCSLYIIGHGRIQFVNYDNFTLSEQTKKNFLCRCISEFILDILYKERDAITLNTLLTDSELKSIHGTRNYGILCEIMTAAYHMTIDANELKKRICNFININTAKPTQKLSLQQSHDLYYEKVFYDYMYDESVTHSIKFRVHQNTVWKDVHQCLESHYQLSIRDFMKGIIAFELEGQRAEGISPHWTVIELAFKQLIQHSIFKTYTPSGFIALASVPDLCFACGNGQRCNLINYLDLELIGQLFLLAMTASEGNSNSPFNIPIKWANYFIRDLFNYSHNLLYDKWNFQDACELLEETSMEANLLKRQYEDIHYENVVKTFDWRDAQAVDLDIKTCLNVVNPKIKLPPGLHDIDDYLQLAMTSRFRTQYYITLLRGIRRGFHQTWMTLIHPEILPGLFYMSSEVTWEKLQNFIEWHESCEESAGKFIKYTLCNWLSKQSVEGLSEFIRCCTGASSLSEWCTKKIQIKVKRLENNVLYHFRSCFWLLIISSEATPTLLIELLSNENPYFNAF